MKRAWRILAIGLVVLASVVPTFVCAQVGAHVKVLTVTGTIDTWVEGYIQRGISAAEQDAAEAVIIVLNTPGGALNATQNITTRMLTARVPVVVFVYPPGGMAASAGTFVTMAANVAAMAPGTTIGAAHPIDQSGQNIPSDAREKARNMTASIAQSIARERGRNDEWVVKAVKESVAATAQEALDLKVIDLLATDVNDLLNKLDGRKVKTAAGEVTLHTQRVGVVLFDMNLAEIFLHTLVDPNIALILLNIGLLAIAVELYNPGATLPAVVGGICLVLAFVALGNLPVNWGGVILIVLAVIFFIIDIKVTGFVLTAGGFVMFVLGALLLFTPFTPPSPTMPEVSVSPVVVFGLGGAMAAFFLFVLGAAVRSRNLPVLSGVEALSGATGIAISDLAPSGMAHVRGEDWTAEAQEGIIRKGEEVRVVGVEGLRLKVVKK